MPKRTEEQRLMRKWWMLLALAIAFLGLSYGFVSLAIDSGSLWQYAVGIIFLVWAVRYIVRTAKMALSR
ncbi:hypothetical protein HYU82_02045 [Candidatus Saccharibacteria bacterium]|nr:hypothetical protein [Candidatus Saccharibacteria bacterium]